MLTFNLKKEWFEKIKSGEKTHVYREVKPYWDKRLKTLMDEAPYKRHTIIQFCCGYPPKNDKNKRVFAILKSVYVAENGYNSDLKVFKPVFDIHFEVIKGEYNGNNV